MTEEPTPGIPVPESEPTAEPAAEETDPDTTTVVVQYRGTWPGKDKITNQRWQPGEEREIPYPQAVQLCAGRFFWSKSIPGSEAISR